MYKTLLFLFFAVWQVDCHDPKIRDLINNLTMCTNCDEKNGTSSLGFKLGDIIEKLVDSTQLTIIKQFLASSRLTTDFTNVVSSRIISVRHGIGKGVGNVVEILRNVPIVGKNIGQVKDKCKHCMSTNDTAVTVTVNQIAVCAQKPALKIIKALACVADDMRDIRNVVSFTCNQTDSKILPLKVVSKIQCLVQSKDTHQIATRTVMETFELVMSIATTAPSIIVCDGSNSVKNLFIRGVGSAQSFGMCMITK